MCVHANVSYHENNMVHTGFILVIILSLIAALSLICNQAPAIWLVSDGRFGLLDTLHHSLIFQLPCPITVWDD